MSHELEINKDGTARMAYAGDVPWHRLGKQMNGLQTAESMLAAAMADFDVVTTKVAAVDDSGHFILNPDGTPIIIEDSRATVRVNYDGTFDGLSTVGTRYVPTQNKEALQRALDVVGASAGEAVVETAGVLRNGKEFFASVNLGGLIIDPTGVNDKIERYLLVRNGHDGKIPITYANTSIRAVCRNTVMMALAEAQSVFTARHTRNQDVALEQAGAVLRISSEWARAFKETAEKMLQIPVPNGSRQFDKVFDAVFPANDDFTKRQRENHDELGMRIRGLYLSAKNARGYGMNGWSTYNAIGEYLDHHREAGAADRAAASMDQNSWVSKKKQIAQNAILSLS
jgi:phage/plasmid-like protein (TIGR03299 family)